MSRKYLGGWCQFDDLTQIHDGHTISHVAHDQQVMADEQVAQVAFAACAELVLIVGRMDPHARSGWRRH